jgi:hypothetical protein
MLPWKVDIESEHLETAEGKRMTRNRERWIRGYKSIKEEDFEEDGRMRRNEGREGRKDEKEWKMRRTGGWEGRKDEKE